MTAPERFADSQIPLAPRAPSIHDPSAAPLCFPSASFPRECGLIPFEAKLRSQPPTSMMLPMRRGYNGNDGPYRYPVMGCIPL